MKKPGYDENKLTGVDLGQSDETMLNFKWKQHKRRSAKHRSNSINIVEIDCGIKTVFEKIIPDKSERNLISTILTML